ncbi:MAG: hypothetical protein H0T48_08915 [Gemmatimonadaceae bacterium]|nr:hypothetical protein [Gemmatimonadaceae bacterium]
MRLDGRVLSRHWKLAVGVVLLIAVHGFLYRALSNMTLPVAVVAGVILLIAIKHVGLLGTLYARFRRRPRP